MREGAGGVEARRRALGLTREALGVRAGVSIATVKRVETGRAVTDLSVNAVLRALDEAEAARGPRAAPAAPDAVDASPSSTVPVLAGDGSAWATHWRELVVASVALSAVFAWSWLVELTWPPTPPGGDPLPGMRYYLANKPSLLGCGAVACWIIGCLAYRAVALRGARMSAGRRLALPYGRSMSFPSLSWSRDGVSRRSWPGGAMAVLALPLAAFLIFSGSLPEVVVVEYYLGTPDAQRTLVPAWSVPPGSTLALAGALAGDRLLAVDGDPVSSYVEALTAMGLDAGRPSRLTVERRAPGSDDRHPITVRADLTLVASKPCAYPSPSCVDNDAIRGLFSPLRMPVAVGDRVRAFLDDVGTGFEMMGDPDGFAACTLILDKGMPVGCGHRWSRWITFGSFTLSATMTVLRILWLLVAVPALLAGGAAAVPGARRGLRRFRARSTRAGPDVRGGAGTATRALASG